MMRNVAAASSVPLLLSIVVGLILPAPSAQGGKSKGSNAPVLVSVDRRAYPPGISGNIRVDNKTRHPLFPPGCASYPLERFDKKSDGFVPLPPRRCTWENNAIPVPPGDRTFTFKPPPRDERMILRAVVTYGVGCRDGVPLSRARCKRVDTAYSRSFVVLQAAGK